MTFAPVLAALSQGQTFKPLESKTHVFDNATIKKGRRRNGRRLEEMPPLFFCLNPHPAYTGSALFSIGQTRVSAAVSGPHPRVLQPSRAQPRNQKDRVTVVAASRTDATLELSIQFAPFAEEDSRTLDSFLTGVLQCVPTEADEQLAQEQTSRARAEYIMETLRSSIRTSAYPNSLISIEVLILNDDGTELYPAIVNAISLALLEARIAMHDMLAAAVSYVVEMPGEPPVCCLQLDGEELQAAQKQRAKLTTTTLAMLTQRSQVAFIRMIGDHLVHPLDQQLLQLAESACVAVSRELGRCIAANGITIQ